MSLIYSFMKTFNSTGSTSSQFPTVVYSPGSPLVFLPLYSPEAQASGPLCVENVTCLPRLLVCLSLGLNCHSLSVCSLKMNLVGSKRSNYK